MTPMVRFDRTETPKLDRISVESPEGFVVGNVGPSHVIADMFTKAQNPARWQFLQSLKAPTAWLDQILINKKARGKGVGKALFGASLQALMDAGVRYVVLSPQAGGEMDPDRLDRFYRNFGFVDVREFERQPLWNRLMALDLASVDKSN
jgi:GNAT superfamily N-acetyltransferase